MNLKKSFYSNLSTILDRKDYLKSRIKEKYFPWLCMRPMIKHILENHNHLEDLVCAEIGVCAGHNSYNMLKVLPIKKIFLIDPYCEYVDNAGLVGDYSRHMETAHKRLEQYSDKIEWIRDYSENAYKKIPDNLDFVYIDGNHRYDIVMKDIELYYPKVKPGGIIGGHDMFGECLGVVRAVLDYTDQNEIKLYSRRQCWDNDWWIIK